MLTVDLTKAGDMTVNSVVLPDAVRLRELLFHIQDHVTISPLNLKLGGELKIDGTLNSVPVASATVGINWDLLQAGAPTITPSTNFAGLFGNFNPVPNLFGQATGADSTTVLVASAANFTDSAIGVQLHNVTDGSSCAATGATTLTCKDLGGGHGQNGERDLYRLDIGSPLALLGCSTTSIRSPARSELTGTMPPGPDTVATGISPANCSADRRTASFIMSGGDIPCPMPLQPAQVDPSQWYSRSGWGTVLHVTC